MSKSQVFSTQRRVWSRLGMLLVLLVAVVLYDLTFPSLFVQGQGQPSKQGILRVSKPARDRYIVALTGVAATANIETVGLMANDLANSYGGDIVHLYRHAFVGFATVMSEAAATALSKDPRVAYVEEDSEGTAVDTQYSPPWGLDRIDQRDLPLSGTYSYPTWPGNGVAVYVIDSGILPTHLEFGSRVYVGWDAVGDGQNGIDCNGHGTHVTGIVAGSTYGIAKVAAITTGRVLDCNNEGFASQALQVVDWITSRKDGNATPFVVNMSVQYAASVSLDSAIRNSIATGVVYTIAAGNGTFNNGIPTNAAGFSPARVAEAITVGATDSSDNRAYFSNFGSIVDVFAPGVGILSAWIGSNSSTMTISGTSMAAPHVAGVAAVYFQSHTTATPATVRRMITYNATSGKIPDPGLGSPNLLLYSTLSAQPPDPSTVPLHRFRNPASPPLRHFYTTNYNEGAGLGYVYELIQCHVYPDEAVGTKPLHRSKLLNPDRHFYSTNHREGMDNGWENQMVAGYVHASQVAGTVPLYRFRQPVDPPLCHFYTTNYNEGVAAGFIYEVVQCYVYP